MHDRTSILDSIAIVSTIFLCIMIFTLVSLIYASRRNAASYAHAHVSATPRVHVI